MRNELELIGKIERYLNNQLSAIERTEFESQINSDSSLREEIILQQEIMKGIERASLKQKVQNARRRYNRIRNFTKWGLGAGIILGIIVTILFTQKMSNKQISYEGKNLPEYNEAGERNWSRADEYLAAQVFYLDAAIDTVIETKGGIVLSVPANGFLSKDGQIAEGKIELIIKEALDPASIIRAGLSTRSGDRLLETGGMFLLDARKNGEILSINPNSGIYAEVPTDTVKPGMQLFSGKRMSDGSIDWVNPKAIDNLLVSVNIQSLNFYPPLYLDSLKSWGYHTDKKSYTDSVYYSLASVFAVEPRMERTGTDQKLGDSSSYSSGSILSDSLTCGINPAKIKTIWNKHFQNTLISTREFEERLSWIHRSHSDNILDLYVNNLDRELSYIDSLAVRQLKGNTTLQAQFSQFASRHNGKVKNGIRQFDKLKEYYQRKSAAFAEAIVKTQRDFWNKQADLDNIAYAKTSAHYQDSLARINAIFEAEFAINLKEAWRQLGYDTIVNTGSWDRSVYTVQVTSTGWCNVDRYVEESLQTRTSLNYTDPKTGKKAIIKYLPFSFQVLESGKFDRLIVYLLPDKISSFMLMTGVDGKYTENLNELMNYKLLCIGYIGDQKYFYAKSQVLSKDYSGIVLSLIDGKDLDRELNKMSDGSLNSAIKKGNTYMQYEITDQKRRKRNQDLLELRQRLTSLIFPCFPVEPVDYDFYLNK